MIGFNPSVDQSPIQHEGIWRQTRRQTVRLVQGQIRAGSSERLSWRLCPPTAPAPAPYTKKMSPANSGPRSSKIVWPQCRRRRRRSRSPARIVLRLPGTQRSRQVDHHPHAHRTDSRRWRLEILGFKLPGDELEIKKRIGLVPEESLLFDRLSGAEFLEFVGRMYGLPR